MSFCLSGLAERSMLWAGKCGIMHLNQDYKLRIFAGQYYLFSVSKAPSSDTVIQLTETAAWIWTQIEKGFPLEEIIARMTEEFEVDPATAGKAVKQFIEALRKRGMLEKTGTETMDAG